MFGSEVSEVFAPLFPSGFVTCCMYYHYDNMRDRGYDLVNKVQVKSTQYKKLAPNAL